MVAGWGVDGRRAPPRFLFLRQFRFVLPEQITLLAPAAIARPEKRRPAGRRNRPAGPVAGWGEQRLLGPAVIHCWIQEVNVSPDAPGQKRIARASPSPEIRTAGQQRAISKARKRLGRRRLGLTPWPASCNSQSCDIERVC